MEKKNAWLVLSLMTGTLVCGCGTKQMVNSEVPSDHPEAKAGKVKVHHYVVKKKDTLWAIAGKSSVYGDPFEWPLLFKENRDKIQDPDLIYPAQSFQYTKSVDSSEKQEARQLADETPKYDPHDTPRTKLPINYF